MNSYFKCTQCGKLRESEKDIVVCDDCLIEMKKTPYKASTPVEVKNPYHNTDIYGQVIQDE